MSKTEIYSANIEKCRVQPLHRIAPPWDDFQTYREELFNLISIMPRQLFEPPRAAAARGEGISKPAHMVEKTTADGVLTVNWKIDCVFSDPNDIVATGLFYKIETILIRPLLNSHYEDLRRCLPLGTFGEIARRINVDPQKTGDVRKAIDFGTSISISLLIGKTNNKAPNKTRVSGGAAADPGLTFGLFNYGLLPPPSGKISSKEEPADEEEVYIFPSPLYAEVLNSNLNIEKGDELSRMSPFALRLLEFSYWKALVDERGAKSFRDENSRMPAGFAEIAGLFPISDPMKLTGAIAELAALRRG